MTTEQIRSHFSMHATYVASLHQIPLSPVITNLDTVRTEVSAARILERTTREWATSLKLADGTHAQCDAENGRRNKNTYLLVPASYASEIKAIIPGYKERLQTVKRREEKYYKDNISDYPTEINITGNVQTNLDFMVHLSSADLWNKAPASVKIPPTSTAKSSQATQIPTVSPASTAGPQVSTPTTWTSVRRPPLSDQTTTSNASPKKRGRVGSKLDGGNSNLSSTLHSVTSIDNNPNGDGVTTDTQSLTNTLRSAKGTRLHDLEEEMRKCQDMLRSSTLAAESTATRLERTEEHLATTMASVNALTRSVSGLQLQFGRWFHTSIGIYATIN